MKLGVIDSVVPEPLGGAHRDPNAAAHNLEQYLAKTLRDLKRTKVRTCLNVGTKNSGRWGNTSKPRARQPPARRADPRHNIPFPRTRPSRAVLAIAAARAAYNPTHGIAHAGHSESHESVRAPAGIGMRSAERIAFHLLKENQEEAFALSDANPRREDARAALARSAII